MNDTEQATDRTAGSVPHAYRNALFWRWAPAMPKGLPASFLAVLYALSTAAAPDGKVRFRDGTVIRLKDIAAASKCDEKDARRNLNAAIAAGVLAIDGDRRRGRAALYILVVTPVPDWEAALHSLRVSKRDRKERQAPPWRAEEKGGRSPELPDSEKGGPPPVLDADHDQEERGTAPLMGSGDRPPFGSGDRPPNNPGNTHGVSHDGAEVVGQPQVDRGWDLEEPPLEDEPPHDQDGPDADHADATTADAWLDTHTRCEVCGDRMIHRPGRPNIHAHCAHNAATPGAA